MSSNRDNIIAYLLSETTTNPTNNYDIINYNSDSVTINADLQDFVFNRNTRQYGYKVLKEGLERENIQELIQNNSWFGEAGHPVDPTMQRQMTVVQNNISHRILNYKINTSMVTGKVKTTPTKQGRFMRDMILDDDPMKSAFSLRAVGPVRETPKGKIVQSPLTVVTYDWVFYPSHKCAYQTSVVGVNKSGNTLTESVCIPILESSALDYIAEESKNYKLISNIMDIAHKEAKLSEDAKKVLITDIDGNNKNTIVVGIEDYISNDICDYFGKFNQ